MIIVLFFKGGGVVTVISILLCGERAPWSCKGLSTMETIVLSRREDYGSGGEGAQKEGEAADKRR